MAVQAGEPPKRCCLVGVGIEARRHPVQRGDGSPRGRAERHPGAQVGTLEHALRLVLQKLAEGGLCIGIYESHIGGVV